MSGKEMKIMSLSMAFVRAGFGLDNAWAKGTVLRPFLQPESSLSSQEFGLRLQVQDPGFEIMTHICWELTALEESHEVWSPTTVYSRGAGAFDS